MKKVLKALMRIICVWQFLNYLAVLVCYTMRTTRDGDMDVTDAISKDAEDFLGNVLKIYLRNQTIGASAPLVFF